MKIDKTKTYAEKLLKNKQFRKEFEQEYKKLVISQKIAAACGADLRISFIRK
jgi:hypothetical protein